MAVVAGPDTSTRGLYFAVDSGNPKSYPGTGSIWYNLSSSTNGSNNNMIYSSDNNGYFEFNNSNSVSIFPNSPELNPTEGLTIESWVMFYGNDNDFIYEKGNVNTQHSLFSHGGGLNDIRFRTYHVGGGGHDLFFDKTAEGFTTNTWWHIVATYDRTYKRIYLNGTQRAINSETRALLTQPTSASIGRFGGTTSGYYFGGRIAIVNLYNVGLTDQEVNQNFERLRSRFGI
jgi:hypothetical protein